MMQPTLNYSHGTLTMYNYRRCRCAECREAKNRYAREHGTNRRTGKRREQKAKHDLMPCPECGQPMAHHADRCLACYRTAQAERRQLLERLWAAGLSCREIGETLGWKAQPSVQIARYRARGYDLPYRYRVNRVAA